MRSVVPRICAGACRASSIVSSALVVTPAPATVRNRRRLTEALTGTGGRSLIAVLLVERSNSLGRSHPNARKRWIFLPAHGDPCQVAHTVITSGIAEPLGVDSLDLD